MSADKVREAGALVLGFLEERFGNVDGNDWSDERAGFVADELESALAALAETPEVAKFCPHGINEGRHCASCPGLVAAPAPAAPSGEAKVLSERIREQMARSALTMKADAAYRRGGPAAAARVMASRVAPVPTPPPQAPTREALPAEYASEGERDRLALIGKHACRAVGLPYVVSPREVEERIAAKDAELASLRAEVEEARFDLETEQRGHAAMAEARNGFLRKLEESTADIATLRARLEEREKGARITLDALGEAERRVRVAEKRIAEAVAYCAAWQGDTDRQGHAAAVLALLSPPAQTTEAQLSEEISEADYENGKCDTDHCREHYGHKGACTGAQGVERMKHAEWTERMGRIRDPNAIRLAFAALAFSSAQSEPGVTELALCSALGITSDQLEAAFTELERVGLGRSEWRQ